MLAAVSGGGDSTALLCGLAAMGVDVVAAHYDHGLRAGSADDGRQVARLCARLGVPLQSGRRAGPLPPGSPEAAARSLRYAFLEAARQESGASLVALAHTADDRVEGLVLHLLRGCGIAGARGMPARRGPFVRPLLGAWRDDLRADLRRSGIVWLEDPTNTDLSRSRARVRHELLPRLERDRPGISRRLLGAAERCAALQEHLAARAALGHAGSSAGRDGLAGLEAPVRREALRRMFAAAGGAEPGLSRRHLEAMERLVLRRATGAALDLPGGLEFRVGPRRAEVVTRTVPAGAPAEPTPTLFECPGCAEPGAFHLRLGLPLTLGRRRPGLRLRPAGGRGRRKLQDLLVDAKVPRWERDRLPLLFVGDRLACVPGLAAAAEFAVDLAGPGLHVGRPSGEPSGDGGIIGPTNRQENPPL